MSLLLTVPDEIVDAVSELSHRSGETPEELLLRALRAHFPQIPTRLVEEFSAWEQASDFDHLQFDTQLNEDANGKR